MSQRSAMNIKKLQTQNNPMAIIQKYMIQTFAFAALNVIITAAYIAYKNYMGYFWANVFIFGSVGALPLLSILLVLTSLVLLSLSIWRVCGVLIYFKVNKYLTTAAKIISTLLFIFLISGFNLISAISLVSLLGLQNGAGYQP